MSTTIRAFVAVRVPVTPPLRNVHDELAHMGRAVKPVAPQNLHVTLKFLGETDASWIDRTCELLDDIATRTTAFDITLRGLGAFPQPSRPSAIWTGITPPEPMTQLAASVEGTLTQVGFAAEPRPFRPHVTLARVKARPPRELVSLVEFHADTEFARMPVRNFVLMQSELSPAGPTYTSIHVATLGAPDGTPR